MRMFECPSCGNPCHPEHMEYDEYGAGCPHCGNHMTNQQIMEAQKNGEKQSV